MRNIRWLDSAELELANIVRYIGLTFGIDTASRVFDDIILRVEALQDFPYMGTLDPSVKYHGLEVYVLHNRHARLFYSITQSVIIVVLVWNNRRDERLIESAIELSK